ncbi:hypothetical protein PPYR_08500 [Photinus pyralis]|uniref:pseudouridine 5'-phosphatase n=2 Tax=Photinus pyralis TaxID=7054 RepID=A0A1Y1L8V5_PHOPY|nr:probable pseudouridine-5'-phosphatase isoform X2 [Photinus pyralis]XP_031344924.1 probable pseudouridine-5'-phosphatase isoform X2 [Photinus pyralis]KAB0797507.1 hypothetical protein PPYR_08500 [Photinus pyralis]
MRPVSSTKNAFLKVTHVIFDLDGLILDTETIYTQATNNVVQVYGKTFDWEVKSQVMGLTGEEAARKLVKLLDLPITWKEYYLLAQQQYQLLMPNAKFMPGAENLIKHLSQNKVPIAVATSSSKDSANLKTAKYKDTFNLFSHIVTGGSDPEVKHGKPSPDIFLVCASRFADSPDPQKCLVFEDAPNGVLAATEAGMQCVMVPDEHITTEQTRQATQVLKSLTDVKLELFGLPPLK